MVESNELLENESELHEHYMFTVEKGQQPLRIDKYLMNFLKMPREIKSKRPLKMAVFWSMKPR